METLNLQSNAIGGLIPENICNLNSLKILYLQTNKLNGAIPSGLSGITQLQKFSIANNLFTGTIPFQFNQLGNIQTLDLSGNGFDALATPFTYDLNRIYLNLKGQLIQKSEYLDYSAGGIAVDLPFINAYNADAGDYNGKFLFDLQANGITIAEATSNGKTLVFPDVNLTVIPQGAQISIWQGTGTASGTIIQYAGIRDNSSVPIVESEYNALVKLYQQTNGAKWTIPWNVLVNNINQVSWNGIVTSDGHIISIDLSNNNLQGVIPSELTQLTELRSLVLKQNKLSGAIPSGLSSLSKLTNIDLSENQLTDLTAAFSPGVNLKLDRQAIKMDTLQLTTTALLFDNSINRYDQASGLFGNQSYSVNIGSYNKTVSVPAEGLRMTNLMNQWNIPNKQAMTLWQIGGAARNSMLTYIINYSDGDANMDGSVNILDIQSIINVILNQYPQYFNFGAGDMNKDNFVNLLDVILVINQIQKSSISGAPSRISLQNSENASVLSIENGILYLENPIQKTGAFDIRLKGVEKSQIRDLLKQQGYTLSISGMDGETSVIGFTSEDCLTGKIAVAEVPESVQIVDALISNENAEAINYSVKTVTGLHQPDEDSNSGSVSNYPNPFNNSTIIKYYLPERAGKVMLKVFSPTGQTVYSSDNLESSPGNHEIQFLQNNLSSGIYFYQIEVHSQEQTHIYKNKMIIK